MWFNISIIEEENYILNDLIKRNILSQYKKAKNKVISWINSKSLDIKYRNPKSKNIISFRINKKFRAFCHLEWNNLIVFKIDNHQN